MRKLLWGAAAIAAFGAQAAHAETSGHIDGSYENSGGYNNNYATNTWDLGGAVQTDIAAGWTVQLDGQVEMQEWNHASGDSSHGYTALHADTSLGSWQVGGFVGLMNWYGDGGKIVGAEARTSFGNLSVQASAAYTAFNSNDDYHVSGVRAEGSYFFSPNLAVTANVGFSNAGYESDGGYWDTDIRDLGIGVRYLCHDKVEVFGGYQNTDTDFSNYTDYTVDSYRVGIRFHFNGGTLQEETNSGASWNGAQAIQETFRRSDW